MKVALTLLSVLFLLIARSQTYWQQEVNYTITVKLDDKKHQLHGYESFEYINHSPQTLDFIYMHIWPNAYTGKNTALGKQLYEGGEQLLTYGADSLKGGIDSLDFSVNGVKALLTPDDKNPDIALLKLPEPLNPGERITVTTPFRVTIPSGEISRLGHIGQSYQVTQWYPKPAVFDKNGWNQMPYLNQGEFYSEYGSYDVSITLPENYVVGATGDLQTSSEIAFLDQKALEAEAFFKDYQPRKKQPADPFPPSASTMKTIRYKQSNVHDFAWFADKRYMVLKGEVELPASKRKVTSWAMFTPRNAGLWSRAIEYINDGTYYYSKWNGDYPYNQVTAVDGTISAGGGMEYPNVTVIGNTSNALELEVVIVHEVGHNWFYGILGSNERVHGWMDEGMNTLNELRYIYTKHPENKQLSDMILNGRFHLDNLSHYDMADYTFRLVAGMGEDQPIETHSADFTSANYGAVMYMKTGLVFTYLKHYLGDELFDKCMHAYFEEWKFKHPQPGDMRTVLERESGKDLGWLFDDLIKTTKHLDYKLTKVQVGAGSTEVTVKNSGQVNGPIEVGAYQDGKLVATQWAEPSGEKTTLFFQAEADEVRVNASERIPELNRQNNYWKSNGLFGKVEKPKLEFLIGNNEPARTNLFWSPVIAANAHDGFMLGAALHNISVPQKPFQFLVAPLYSFGGQHISGVSEVSYTFLPERSLKLSRFGVSVKSFKQTDLSPRKNDGYYVAVAPYWFAKLGNRKAASPIGQSLLVQSMYRLDKNGPSQKEQVGGYVKYAFEVFKRDHRFTASLRTDFLSNAVNGEQLGRSSVELIYRNRYLRNKEERWLELRGYAGTNWLFTIDPLDSYNYCLNLSGANGSQDLFLEDYFLGRGEPKGFLAQQRLENMGGFKNTTDIGINSKWVTAANFYMQLPVGPKFIGIFADAGVYPNGLNGKTMSAYDAGVALRFGKFFGLYFPVIVSENIRKFYPSENYTNRIRMTLNLNIVNKPFKIAEFL